MSVFCSEKKGKKPVLPSLCITKKKLGSVCPSQRTRGNKVIGFGAAAFFLVAIERWAVLRPPTGQRQGRDVGQGVNLDEKCTICTFYNSYDIEA